MLTTTTSVQLHVLHVNTIRLLGHATTDKHNFYSVTSTLKPLKNVLSSQQQISLLSFWYLLDGCGNMIPEMITWLHQPITKLIAWKGNWWHNVEQSPHHWWHLFALYWIKLQTHFTTCWHTFRHLYHQSQCGDSDHFTHFCANTVDVIKYTTSMKKAAGEDNNLNKEADCISVEIKIWDGQRVIISTCLYRYSECCVIFCHVQVTLFFKVSLQRAH